MTSTNQSALAITLCAIFALWAQSASGQQRAADLSDISLEDLMKIEVTSVSKKDQELFSTPSAVFVLTHEDIRRSGVDTLTEALRMVPGVSVARVDSSKWAITARGFNSLHANKLLVLVDGRSVYSPIFSGVYWDTLDLALEDIERIEFIRGPGATMWGANAVNGVINIISKTAATTQGALVTAGAGSLLRGSGSLRYGGQLGDNAHYRIFGKYTDRRDTQAVGSDAKAGDSWNTLTGGVRVDFALSGVDALRVEAHTMDSELDQQVDELTGFFTPRRLLTDPIRNYARGLAVRWDRKPSATSGLSLQASFYENRRDEHIISEDFDRLDLELQHRLSVGRRHDVVWGVGERLARDRIDGTFNLSFTPGRDDSALTNGFVQDEIAIIPSRLTLTVGSKFEHHKVSGVNAQPSVRASWTPSASQNVWGAVSRAVRTPSRVELGLRVNYATITRPGAMPTVLSILGNPEFRPESVVANEVGYRVQVTPRLQIDTTAFHNAYSGLQGLNRVQFVETTPAPTHLVIGQQLENQYDGTTSGVESVARWAVLPKWRLDAGYSWLHANFGANSAGVTRTVDSPSHQWHVASRLTLPRSWQFDTTLFRVGEIADLAVAPYTRLDVRLGVDVMTGVSVSLAGQNLLDPSHVEFGQAAGEKSTEIPRSATLKLAWHF